MTSSPAPKKRNVTSTIGAGDAYDRIQERRDSAPVRRAAVLDEFDQAEAAFEAKVRSRVAPEHVERLDRMLATAPTPDAPTDLPRGAQPLDPKREQRLREMAK